MDAGQAKALREPFPRSAIGHLPKGGVMLDYVGHAAVSDRLLAVDPDWSWEPFAVDDRGLPALDSRGNLWIRLTVAGVTRIGVGDGKSAKEVIGDAIRNAAMRFGVALDLWAKEDLHEISQVRSEPDTQPAVAAEPAPSPKLVTQPQLAKIHAGLGDLEITERVLGLAYISGTVGRQFESSKDLTASEASHLIDAIDADLAAFKANPDGPS